MSRTARKSWSPGSQRRRDSLFALCFWFYFVSLLVVSTTSVVAAFLSPSSIAHHNNYNPHSLSSSSSSSAVTRSSTVTPGRGPEPARLLLRTAVLRRHFPTTASSTVGACGRLLLAATTTATGDDTAPVPFLIERIQGTPSCKALYTEIAAMCIEAFFNDDSHSSPSAASTGSGSHHHRPEKNHSSSSHRSPRPPFFLPFSTPPLSTSTIPTSIPIPSSTPVTKSLQLAYLRTLQSGDLQRRRERDGDDANAMFVARRLVPLHTNAQRDKYKSSPLVVEYNNAHNCQDLFRRNTNGNNSWGAHGHRAGVSDDIPDVVRGEILGFVEVTNRPFGLGGGGGGESITLARPVLTNLSVCRDARRSGVGSCLLDMCEQYVATEWGQPEVVLEVEDDNEQAKDFYRKRGYDIVYTDHTARRYDLSGLWLREVRCRRLVMRKQLQKPEAVQNSVHFGIKVLQVLRDNVFAAVA